MKQKEKIKKKERILVVVDSSVLVNIIEDNNDHKSKDFMKLISKLKGLSIKDRKMNIITTANSLFNSIWKAKSSSNLQGLQDILEVISVAPLDKNQIWKDKEFIRNEIILIAKMASDPGKSFEEFMKKHGETKSK